MTDARSVISETSTVDHPTALPILDDTDDFELQERIDRFEREIVQYTLENALFESILERNKSEPISRHHSSAVVQPPVHSSQPTTSNVSNHESTNASATSRSDRLGRKRSRSRSTQGDFRIQLTIEQKLEFVMTEYEQMKNEKLRYETIHGKELDELETDCEWMGIEIADNDSAIVDFLKARDAAIDKRTNRLMGDKIIRHLTERLKAHGSLINRLRDRSFGLKQQIVRLDNQIKQNEEMGETLQEVDFNQLKIENQQFLDKIDEKNLELVFLKQQVARFTHMLNHYKDELQIQTQDLIDIEKRLEKQQILYEHAQRELSITNFEHTRAARRHSHLVEQTENYRVPEIIDYVRQKALLYNLQRECEVWQRKVDLVSMGLEQSKQKWQILQRTVRYFHNPTN